MFSYALKRVMRSFGFFTALLLGVILATTFFTGINISADTTAKAALDQQLNQVLVDITVSQQSDSLLKSANWVTMSERIALISSVKSTELISRVETEYQKLVYPGNPYSSSIVWFNGPSNYSQFEIVGTIDNSLLGDGLEVISGTDLLQENEAYVWTGSQDAAKLSIGDTLAFNCTVWFYPNSTDVVSLELSVAGFVNLEEKTRNLALGVYQSSTKEDIQSSFRGNIIIVSWERTFAKLIDAIYPLNPSSDPTRTEIMVLLDREELINPWDVEASQETIKRIMMQIQNEAAALDLRTNSNLPSVLLNAQDVSTDLRTSFLILSLPVFFVAWFVGTTVSDVSFNLRRREIGLLLAKGLSSRQLLGLFLSESLIIGVLGSLVGVGLSLFLSPYFVPAIGKEFVWAFPVLTLEVTVLGIAFGVGLCLLSNFRAAKNVAKLSVINALKEYAYIKESNSSRRRWSWFALFLGSYEITMYLLGVPRLSMYFTSTPSTTNIVLWILMRAWIIIDEMLTIIGPLLFLWGFTKIFILSSSGFQRLVTRVARLLGDLGKLAARNVRRAPARVASVAFLIALIVGYGLQTVGGLSSEEDYIVRRVKTDVGADISVTMSNLDNASEVERDILKLSGIASATLECAFIGQMDFQSLKLVAVSPQEWLHTAYYESDWFSGNDVTTAFQQISAEANTIILEKTVAENLNLGIGDSITLWIGYETMSLAVVGFFGPRFIRSPQPIFSPNTYQSSSLWSYVSINIYHSLDEGLSASGKILVKLETPANGVNVATQIRALESSDISYVSSVEEKLEAQGSDLQLSGSKIVQRIGVIFTIVAASVATTLVALVSLQERKKEVTIMSIRGLSFKQLMTVVLLENLATTVFAVGLGVVVGLVVLHGSIAALNTVQYSTPVTRRIVFSLDAVLTLLIALILVFSSSLLPVIAVTKRYISKLDRIVRA